MAEGQIAVLIDVENVGLSPVQELFDQLANVGRIIVKRAYGDWSGTRARDRERLQGLGIDPIQVFHSGTGKNSADIRLAIDAIELSFQSPVDTFVVVSSDSDFVPLVGKLRAAGKTVIGAGPSAVASRTLVGSCDRYFYLDPKTSSATEPAPDEVRDVGLLVRAVRASMDDDGVATGSRLHQAMQRLDPSFDFRTLGHSTFTRYLEASPSVSVTRPRGKGDVSVRLLESNGAGEGVDPERWGPEVDAAWARRAPNTGQSVYGNTAASAAATALGVGKLKDSTYKTLERLLRASEFLSARWKRDGGKIIRR
jgi:uncharacterized protein (TIGR00288 family)